VARMQLPLRPTLATTNGGIEVAVQTGVVGPVTLLPPTADGNDRADRTVVEDLAQEITGLSND